MNDLQIESSKKVINNFIALFDVQCSDYKSFKLNYLI